MSKKILSSLLALVCLMVFAVGSAEAAKKIVIKMNVNNNPKAHGDLPQVKAVLKFKELMEKRFSDRVQVRIFWDDQLSKSYDGTINALQNSAIQIAQMPLTSMAEFTKAGIPFTNLFLVPYPHVDIIHNAFDAEIGEMVRTRMIKEARVRPLMYWEVGFRHLLNNKGSITNLDSLSSLKFRVQPNPVHLASFKALGTNPTPIPWSELFTALQQGVVDGTENPFENIKVLRLWEVQKYLTLSGHAFEMALMLMGEDFYQSLPDDVKKGMQEVIREVTAGHREGMLQANKKMLDEFKTKMTVNELSREEFERFREAVAKPALEVTRQQAGAEYTDKFFELMAKYKDEYFSRLGK